MRKYFDSIANPIDGRPIEGALINVLKGDGSQQPIYGDPNKAQLLAQPIKTDALGFFQFFVDSGVYTLRIANGASVQTITNVDMTDSVAGAVTADAIIGALGYTPYDSGNPAGYLSSITSGLVNAALGGGGALLKSGGTMTGAVLGVDSNDPAALVTRAYVQSLSNGQVPKPASRRATTGNISLSGIQTVDGVTGLSGGQTLVKNQTAPAENGLYLEAAGAWTRIVEMDTWAEVPGATTFVSGGTTQANTSWSCTSAAGGTLGTTAITFTQTSAQGAYDASGGVKKTGNVFSLTPIANGKLLGNVSGSSAAPVEVTIADLLGYTPANAAGQTFTGEVNAPSVNARGAAGTFRLMRFMSGALNRFAWGLDSVAESGSNAGSNLFLNRYNDAGSFIDQPIGVNRATGVVTINGKTMAEKADLAALALASNSTPGTSLITASQYRTLQQALATFGVNVMDKGAKGDGVTDDINAFRIAVDTGARVIRMPSVETFYNLSDMWRVGRSAKLVGDGCEPYQGSLDTSPATRGPGSWLKFNHSGEGLLLYGTDTSHSGGEIEGIGTIRNQPDPAPGWAPINHNYDLSVISGDWRLDNIMLWNATKGLLHDYAGYGRCEIGRLRGSCFNIGINIDRCADLFRAQDVHFWPFSGFSTYGEWTRDNLIALQTGRCDGATFDSFFCIGAARGVQMVQGQTGISQHIKFGVLYIDLFGEFGIYVDASADGASMEVADLLMQGAVAADGDPGGAQNGIVVAADNSVLKAAISNIKRVNEQAAIVTGNNSTVELGLNSIDAWNRASIGASAYAVTGTGSKIMLGLPPLVTNSGGAIGDGSGKVFMPSMAAI
ncbi:hypothetical protein [Sphingomonas montanisoli]|uniref:Pectate lyase superfamily protein domain-containing protein n=1 Tax=Sphingomonas montanisoli TaxID=2606412 RepID=A0A5D9C2D9_9SPHN|nr:hypothetical protein [Sphingomonas montanisoli]TZG25884.1 hypothetical protein FYJ91_12960 [Sphingomonas montanisoli]